jgi:annexin A7/11
MTVAFYYNGLFNPHQQPLQTYPPHVEQAVQEIHQATKGMGTDEKTLIRALTAVNDADRELIIRRYKELHAKELKDLIKGETSGSFGYLARLLAMPLPEMEAFVVKEACGGAGTNEKLLFPVLYLLMTAI